MAFLELRGGFALGIRANSFALPYTYMGHSKSLGLRYCRRFIVRFKHFSVATGGCLVNSLYRYLVPVQVSHGVDFFAAFGRDQVRNQEHHNRDI